MGLSMVDETQTTPNLQPSGSLNTSPGTSAQQGQGGLQPQTSSSIQQTSQQTPTSINQIDGAGTAIPLNTISVSGSTTVQRTTATTHPFPMLYVSVMVLALVAFAVLAYGLLRPRK